MQYLGVTRTMTCCSFKEGVLLLEVANEVFLFNQDYD